MRRTWLLLAALSVSLPARADDPASVLVKTEMPNAGPSRTCWSPTARQLRRWTAA